MDWTPLAERRKQARLKAAEAPEREREAVTARRRAEGAELDDFFRTSNPDERANVTAEADRQLRARLGPLAAPNGT